MSLAIRDTGEHLVSPNGAPKHVSWQRAVAAILQPNSWARTRDLRGAREKVRNGRSRSKKAAAHQLGSAGACARRRGASAETAPEHATPLPFPLLSTFPRVHGRYGALSRVPVHSERQSQQSLRSRVTRGDRQGVIHTYIHTYYKG